MKKLLSIILLSGIGITATAQQYPLFYSTDGTIIGSEAIKAANDIASETYTTYLNQRIDNLIAGGVGSEPITEVQISDGGLNTFTINYDWAMDLPSWTELQTYSVNPDDIQSQIDAIEANKVDSASHVFLVSSAGTAVENGAALLAKVSELSTYFTDNGVLPIIYLTDGDYDLNGNTLTISDDMHISAIIHKPIKWMYDTPNAYTSVTSYDIPFVKITGDILIGTEADVCHLTGLYVVGNVDAPTDLVGNPLGWATHQHWLVNSRVTGNVCEDDAGAVMSLSGCYIEGRFAGGTTVTWSGHVLSSAVMGDNSFQNTFGATSGAEFRLIQDSYIGGSGCFDSSIPTSGGYWFEQCIINGVSFGGVGGYNIKAFYTSWFGTVDGAWPTPRDAVTATHLRYCQGLDATTLNAMTDVKLHFCTDSADNVIANKN